MSGKKEKIFRNVKKTWNYVKSERIRLIICLVLSLFLCLISSITPFLSAKLLLNLTDNLLDNLLSVAILVFIVEILRNIFDFGYRLIFNKYLMNTVSVLQYNIAKETLRL